MVDVPVATDSGAPVRAGDVPVGPSPVGIGRTAAGGMGQRRRVLLHASGFKQSPYADVKPAGESITSRKLWHSSPGSSGR